MVNDSLIGSMRHRRSVPGDRRPPAAAPRPPEPAERCGPAFIFRGVPGGAAGLS